MSELITVTQLEDVVKNGGQILTSNKARTEKAISVGNNILSAIAEAGGLDDQLDIRCNKFLVNCRDAKKEMEEMRKPITQMFDQIKKEFTSSENDLDIRKNGSVPFIIQSHRNEYVKKIEAEKEKERLANEQKLNEEKERIDIRTAIESQLSVYVRDHITDRKSKLQKTFNEITNENFIAKSKALQDLKPVYHKAHFIDFVPNVNPQYIKLNEVATMTQEVMDKQDFTLIGAVVEGELNAFIKELVEKLPSLKSELDRLAKANEEDKKKIEEAKKQREADDKKKLEDDAAAEKLKKDQELKIASEAQKADAVMDNLAVFENKGPETRSGYEISILHQAGAVEIFTFWFEREGAKCTIDELERKSIGQMKTFCERLAHKDGEMISSKYLKYEAVYKAVNRK